MAVAATTTTTITLSTGSSLFSRLSGEFWQVGRLERKLSLIPRKHLNLVCVSGQYLLSSSKNKNLRPSFALRKDSDDSFLSNVEDTDEMFDDLFKKYGKVVYRNNDKKTPSAEVDDDAESLSFAVEMAKVASDVKAGDIMVLFVKPLVYWTRFFIIATAFSRPQIDAIATRIRDLAEQKYGKVPSGDTKPNSWTLLDFGDVVIHIFLPQQRAFYNLEEFYGNAMPIELPFENKQPPLRS